MGLIGIFDGLYVDQLIQKNDRGEFVLYPHGLMGRGYLLPAEREPAIRQRLRLTMLLSLIVGTMYGLFALRVVESNQVVSLFGWMLVIAIAVLLVGGIIFYQSRLADGLEQVSGPRPSTGEWLRRGRAGRSSSQPAKSATKTTSDASSATTIAFNSRTSIAWSARLGGGVRASIEPHRGKRR